MEKLTIGETLQLTPVWSSANDRVASVSGSGLVTAVSPGTVEIYCTVRGLPLATIVSVVEPPPPVPEPEPAAEETET